MEEYLQYMKTLRSQMNGLSLLHCLINSLRQFSGIIENFF